MEYYSALKRRKILTYAKTWVKLEDIMIGDILLSYKKTNTVQFHLYEVFRIVRFLETESRLVIARFWGRGKQGVFR